MNIGTNLINEVESVLVKFLQPYKKIYQEELLDYYVIKSEEKLEIHGKYKNKYDSEKTDDFIMLRMIVSSEFKQVHIFNIFLPQFMRYKVIGKNMISKIFVISEEYGYGLFLVDMVNSFYRGMINRGALPCDDCSDAVEIVKETKLN